MYKNTGACESFSFRSVVSPVLCLLCGGQGGRISLRSIFSQKQPRVVVRGLTAFPRSWGGRSPITNETVSPTCHSDLVKYDRGIMAGNMWAVASE